MSSESLSYEKVWEMFQETDRQFKEAREKSEREWQEAREKSEREWDEIKKQSRETDRIVQETARIVKKLSKNIGGLNNSLGGLMETLIAARLWEKFGVYNLCRAYKRIPIYNEKNEAISEIDILLSNTEWVMAVEVKREVKEYDIDRHLKRMQWIRDYPPPETKEKKLLGAIAGGEVAPDMANLAHQAGFFVLELKGKLTELISPADFKPRIW